MAPRRKIEETEGEGECLEDKEKKISFSRNAFLLIQLMVKLGAEQKTELLDEILHSIFFLGKLNDPEFFPESIASNDAEVNELKTLRDCFPRAFDLYSSHLPKRSPFSCFLDMIVRLSGQTDDENKIIERLQDFIKQLEYSKSMALVSSTICVSQRNIPESVKYYGVSMSTTGLYPGRIMVAASCLSSWDSKVADAVMTYYPTKTKKPYFDGTIKLQPHVRCQAFNLRLKRKKPPCRSCGNLFGLETSETTQSDYGNCAEAESLSNLLKDDLKVTEQVRPTSETCTDKNREKVKESVLKELQRLLGKKSTWKNTNFYDPDFYGPVRS